MARALRIERPGATYHITSGGNRRQRIFDADHDREHFLALLGEVSRRYGWVISAYVLMTNHFHLLLKTPDANLSQGMKWLNSSYAAWYNRRHQKVGHLFGERYKAIHVQTEKYMQRLARYVILNPVRASMVASPQEYQWSSYRATAGLGPAPEWLHASELVPYFGDASSWQKNYISYVGEGIEKPDPIWNGLRRRIFLGSEDWLRKMRQKVTIKWRQSDIPHDQRAATRPSMGEIVGAVAKLLDVTRREIRRSRGGLALTIAAWLGIYEGRRRMCVIAQRLHLRSCSRVTEQTSGLIGIVILVGFVTVFMVIGAVLGAMNSMFSAIASRKRELATMRALGFKRRAIMMSIVIEAAFIAFLGGVAGVLFALPVNGIATGTTNFQTFAEVAFNFKISPQVAAFAITLAVVAGVIGGLIPALLASRVPITKALREI